MSDNIREKYKNTYSEIEPRAEFLDNLTQTLENEQAKQKRRKIINIRTISSIAACFAIVVGTAVFLSNSNLSLKPDNNDSNNDEDVSASNSFVESEIDNYGDSVSIEGLPIKIEDWDTENMSAVECAEFLEKMILSDELSYILVSDTNVFTDADEADEKEIESLAEMFSDCEESDKLSSEKEITYYMAVFENGLIIKLNIYDEEYIEIPMKEITLKVN